MWCTFCSNLHLRSSHGFRDVRPGGLKVLSQGLSIVQKVDSNSPLHSRIIRRRGAIASVMWLALLWAGPAVISVWASLSPSGAPCCHGKNCSCCKRRHAPTGPQVLSDGCAASCPVLGRLLSTHSFIYLPPHTGAGRDLRSSSSDIAIDSAGVRQASGAAELQRPPPPLAFCKRNEPMARLGTFWRRGI